MNEVKLNPGHLLLAIYPDREYQQADKLKRMIASDVVDVFDDQVTIETVTVAHLVTADFIGKYRIESCRSSGFGHRAYMYARAFMEFAQESCVNPNKIEELSGLARWADIKNMWLSSVPSPITSLFKSGNVFDEFKRLALIDPDTVGELPLNHDVLADQFRAWILEISQRGLTCKKIVESKKYRDRVLSLIQQAR